MKVARASFFTPRSAEVQAPTTSHPKSVAAIQTAVSEDQTLKTKWLTKCNLIRAILPTTLAGLIMYAIKNKKDSLESD